MQQAIIHGISRDDGIRVFWLEGNDTRSTIFTYEDLIGMRINVLDLLNNPGAYTIDADTRSITVRK